jgi:hypothetical protein
MEYYIEKSLKLASKESIEEEVVKNVLISDF